MYLGCRFPCIEAYRMELQEIILKVGNALASKGVIGHFSVDFLAVPKTIYNLNENNINFDLYALEINLRQTGTTHPMMIVKLLTNGYFDEKTGKFLSSSGNEKYYIASDNLKNENYIGLLPQGKKYF